MQSASLNVLHFMPTNYGMTGVETFIVQLAQAQKRAGHSPTIALTVHGRQELVRQAELLDIRVVAMPAIDPAAPHSKLRTAKLRAQTLATLLGLLREHDVLHFHACGFVGLEGFCAAALLPRVRAVVTHHATLTWFASMQNRISDLTFWLEKRVASAAVMPYEAAVEELRQAGFPARRTSAIPLCVDERLFAVPPPPPRQPGLLHLAMVARLQSQKGHAELLHAIARLAPRHPGLRATLYGQGELRDELERLCSELAIVDRVTFAGFVPHEKLPEQLADKHAVVLPSYMPGETFPLSLLEGMAMGLPVIGSRWFGIPDIVAEGVTGWLVDPRSVDDLVRVLERLLSDPSLLTRAGERARERVLAHFTADAVAASYQRLYMGAERVA